ncbi:MAG: M23 family metallopeptidase [Bacteroidales bacterium]
MQNFQILLFIALLLNGLTKNQKEGPKFISPVKIPLSLSANFGELRVDHFHSGLDIRTQGVTGKEVFAVADGYVYRISVSPGGFGNALYVKHPSGYSTVYGHLDRFIPEIEDYVTSRQYEEKSFMVTLWPPKDKFRFSQGDLIAYSGNSGSSSGPHLHYEMRKSDDETPVNPLLYDFGITDEHKPVIEKVAICPAGRHTSINGQNRTVRMSVSGGSGNYHLAADEIKISGPAAFEIRAYDLINNSSNRFSVYSIELRIDSVPVYKYVMDSFSFDESRYINSHIDYETYLRDKSYIERSFILPNDRLSVVRRTVNRGIFDFSDGERHNVEIIVADAGNNTAKVSFGVRSVPQAAVVSGSPVRHPGNAIVMPYGRNNKFVSKNISVMIPSGALYDTLEFEFSRSSGSAAMYSEIYHVHNVYTPLHKAYTLSIRPDRIPAGKESKMLIVHTDSEKNEVPVGGTWENGVLTARPMTFGIFYVGIDTVPPRIVPVSFTPGDNLSGRASLRIGISDDFSGIKTYEPMVDGKWALFEYDQKNNQLIYKFDADRITKGISHSLVLTATDNRDNQSVYKCDFTW